MILWFSRSLSIFLIFFDISCVERMIRCTRFYNYLVYHTFYVFARQNILFFYNFINSFILCLKERKQAVWVPNMCITACFSCVYSNPLWTLAPNLTNSNVRNFKRIVNGLVRFFFNNFCAILSMFFTSMTWNIYTFVL